MVDELRKKAGLFIAIGVVAAVATAHADDKKKVDVAKLNQLVALGLKSRREGKLDFAAACLDTALRDLPEGDDKKVAAEDAWILAFAQGHHDKCARVMKGIDKTRELVAVARAGRIADAVKAAREAKDPALEARALVAAGKFAEAVDAFSKVPGTDVLLEKGDALVSLGKFAEAAKVFEQIGESYRRALALEKAGDSSAASVWEAARVEEKSRLEVLVNRSKDGKSKVDAAKDPSAKDRARLALGDTLAKVVEAYDRFATVMERTGDKALAKKLVEVALQYAAKARAVLTDDGADQFGPLVVKAWKLDEREKKLDERLKAFK